MSEAVGDACHEGHFIDNGSLSPLPPLGYDKLGNTQTHTQTHINTHTHAHKHIGAYCARMPAHTHTHAHMHTHTHTHARTGVCIFVNVAECV